MGVDNNDVTSSAHVFDVIATNYRPKAILSFKAD